jgi:flagellar basal-body rod protein FlgG
LVTGEGLKLEPAIAIQNDAISIGIGSDGTISVQDPTGAVQSSGQITLTNFPNPAGLESLGKNLYRETTASGSPITGTAGQQGIGEIIQGFLESSNVEVVKEMVNIIIAQRAYEISSKVIKASDKMLQAINRLIL